MQLNIPNCVTLMVSASVFLLLIRLCLVNSFDLDVSKTSYASSVSISILLQHLSLFFLPSHAVYNLIQPDHSDLNYGVPFLSLTAKQLWFHSHWESCRVGYLLVFCVDLLLLALCYCPGFAISVALVLKLLSSLAHDCQSLLLRHPSYSNHDIIWVISWSDCPTRSASVPFISRLLNKHF